MTAFYNEIENYACDWTENLIAAGHIAPGVVDRRSIRDLRPEDLAGYAQVHLFAGVGVWSHALRLAGVPDDFPVWTGSCPCQPFSVAGKKGGTDDERHLWPEYHRLIVARRPALLFGEQVSSKDGLAWLDAVLADLEASGYTAGAFDLAACGVGAPHKRSRLYFFAYSKDLGLQRGGAAEGTRGDGTGLGVGLVRGALDGGNAGRAGAEGHPGAAAAAAQAERGGPGPQPGHRGDGPVAAGSALGGDDALGAGLERHFGHVRDWRGPGWLDPIAARSVAEAGATRGHWADCDWYYGRDGKYRPIEPGLFPLADGVAGRVGQLKAYGNAIVAPLAVEFIAAVMDELGLPRHPGAGL